MAKLKNENKKQKLSISTTKKALTCIVMLFATLAMFETFTSESSGGFKNSATPAIPENGWKLLGLSLMLPLQLIFHKLYTFRHPAIINIIYYFFMLTVFLASFLVTLIASF